MSGASLDARARKAGIIPEFRDLFGNTQVAPEESKAAILAAMGLADAPDTPEPALPRWHVCVADAPVALAVPGAWRILLEDGSAREGRGALPALPLGRHRLDSDGARCWLLSAPPRLPLPPKLWGLMAPLACLRSAAQGGLGSYDDLAQLAEGLGAQGAAFVGVNPIHAGFLTHPDGFSPYTPSHRRRFSPLYLPSAAQGAAPGPLLIFSEELPARMQALEAEFRAAPPGDAFERYLSHEGAGLRRFATHQALSERLGPYWDNWPTAYHDPASAEVAQAAHDLADRVRFHAWLQYKAEGALAETQTRATEAGMALGLYLDLAVGTHPHGAETWEDRQSFAFGASLGAPPDAFAPQGQNWHLAPFNPVHLIETGFEALALTLRQQLRFSGALRIDHILGFERAYWVPDGLPGAYVTMPREAMLAVARMEAARAGAVIVGEDLGVIPDGLQQALGDSGILGCRLMCFEHSGDPPWYRAPQDYPEGVIASFSSHDLPTWKGWRAGREITLRRDIGITPPEHVDGMLSWRGREVDGFDGATSPYRDGFAPEAPEAMAALLAATAARMVALQVEDVLGLENQPNMPGTVSEYPNWRQRLPLGVAEITALPVLANAARIMKRAGR
ncbi:4-alpha-glucanotransferase [Salipiger sp. P9]|uniref:4-alpha-glucanotransferase n=1 Tax=Salipiger pentaromativorans TaxID=2943193 RepID=UPI00215799F6|nr:4-alpha-glucanotransferase [Salipiger pentaromativorans]MCR8547271.1 4-alpha-glucanotransferase [Salipiger pentaromativorans]